MAKGGKRPGAGRPRGSLTRRTQEVAARAIAENRTPLEIMLENMLHFQQAAIDAEAILKGLTAEEFTGTEMTPEEQFRKLLAEVKKAAGLRLMAQECARDAAPFVHPRLAQVESKSEVTHHYVARIPEPAETADEWLMQHAPPTVQ